MKLKQLPYLAKGVTLVLTFIALLLAHNGFAVPKKSKKGTKILVFSKTNGFRHACIPVGIEALKKLGAENNMIIDATEDSTVFNDANLKQYKALIFLNPTGNILGDEEEKAFEKYIRNGGGFVGVHAASDCEYKWPFYVKLIGANFASHPHQQVAKLNVIDKNHLSTKHLPDVWERKDEWYNFRNINTDVKVIMTIDEKSYKGGRNGDNHPMAWYHSYEGGRVFYTALGHTDESYSDPDFLQHLLGGIQYAIGKK